MRSKSRRSSSRPAGRSSGRRTRAASWRSCRTYPVAAVVRARRSDADLAARERPAYDLGDFPDAVVLAGRPHVEDLAVDRLRRRFQCAAHRLDDVLDVRDRPPRAAVARHGDLLPRPRERAQVVQHDVETHARRGAIGRRVAKEGDAEIPSAEGADVLLDPDLALRVGGLRVGRRGLVEEASARPKAVDAARRGVHEPLHAGVFRRLRDTHGALVVDLEGHFRPVLAERVVRQLGQMHHRVEALEILRRQRAQVLEHRIRRHRQANRIEVQAAVTVEARVEAGDLVAVRGEDRSRARADVALGAGQQNLHGG